MASKTPKYVSLKRSSFHYQRAIPTKLHHLTRERYFTMPLGLKEGASEFKLFEAANRANNNFDLYCKTLENSDPNAYDSSEIEVLAAQLLKSRGMAAGDLQRVRLDADVARVEVSQSIQLQAHPEDYAALVVPEIDDLTEKSHTGEPLTLHDKVLKRAYDALIQPKSWRRNQTLSSLWPDYLTHKGKDPEDRDVQKATRRWERFLSFVGDGYFVDDSREALMDGLDDYVAERRQQGISEASIYRELAEVVACINLSARKRRFVWKLTRPERQAHSPRLREVLSTEEQVKLLRYALSPAPRDGKICAFVVLGFLCGVIPTEVKRLAKKDVHLAVAYPYVTFLNKAKSEYRRRVVPVVMGLSVMNEYLFGAINWVNETTPSNISACVKRLLRSVTGNDELTIYSLRHTFKMNATQANVSVSALNAIGGWSGGYVGSREMLAYGSAALESTEHLKFLFDESSKIQARLIAGLSRVQEQVEPDE